MIFQPDCLDGCVAWPYAANDAAKLTNGWLKERGA